MFILEKAIEVFVLFLFAILFVGYSLTIFPVEKIREKAKSNRPTRKFVNA